MENWFQIYFICDPSMHEQLRIAYKVQVMKEHTTETDAARAVDVGKIIKCGKE
jgi:hypothetical protein